MQTMVEETIYSGMRREQERRSTPEGFPELPEISGGRYIDPDFLSLEDRHVWKNSWLYALHSDELPKPGSYRLWNKTGSPIIIVRGNDDHIRAFYNTCRHRGAPLIEDVRGETRGFYCRYHGWTYDLSGKLRAVREMRDFPGMDTNCRGLTEVRCEMYGNWVFINENPDAEPLLEAMAPIPRHWENLQVDKFRHIHSDSFDIACNVKILFDAFLETYHLKSIHQQTVDRFLDSRGTSILLYNNGNSIMATPHRSTEWKDPGAEGMPVIETAETVFAEQNVSYNFFPNLITPPSSTGIPFLTFWPNGLRNMVVDVHWFGPEESIGHQQWPTRIDNFARILEEDTQFAPRIQESVESRGFRGMYLSYQERRIYFWHEQLDRRIGAANIPEHLRMKPMLDPWLIDPSRETFSP